MIEGDFWSAVASAARHRYHGVSTGSGSDRVPTRATVEIARTLTRTLPLPVLTSSQIKLTTHSKIPERLALTLLIPLPIISNFAPGRLASVRVLN
jgi:hypothetical protein